MLISCGHRQLDLSNPQVMAILNVTPDSFSDGGAYYRSGRLYLDAVLRQAEVFQQQGASLVDVGGESTRPGADAVSPQEELDRVLPVVEAIGRRIDIVVSVDTSRAQVITEAANLGAGFINDVRALRLPGALAAVAKAGLPVCLMHMQGDPMTMQHNPHYGDCVAEVKCFLLERLQACREAGLLETQILVDPGIGFGKADEHNLALIKELETFRSLGAGVLFGVSRKSMIGRLLGREIQDRLAGSLAFASAALLRGARILRVHDVAETVDLVKVFQLTQL